LFDFDTDMQEEFEFDDEEDIRNNGVVSDLEKIKDV